MIRVGNRGKPRVVENRRGFYKTDAMLLEIGFRLFFVPFEIGVFRNVRLSKLYRARIVIKKARRSTL